MFYTKDYSKFDKRTGQFSEEDNIDHIIEADIHLQSAAEREALLTNEFKPGHEMQGKIKERKQKKLLETQLKITNNFKVFELGEDTYSMAFRALHFKSSTLM